MKLHIDFETRSRVDLKKSGMYRYADDPSTRILCMAYKPDDYPTRLWLVGDEVATNRFSAAIEKATQFVAHNAGFERCIWHYIMHKRFGFPDISAPENWTCTAAKAAALALPRSLDGVGEALNLPVKKDKAGHRLMLKWCKPRKPTKNNPKEWHDDPEEFKQLCDYCIRDVETEYLVDKTLPDLSPDEQDTWILDQKINDTGIAVDTRSAENLQYKVEYVNEKMKSEVPTLGFKDITSSNQTMKIIALLKEHGVDTDTVDAEHLTEFLEMDLPENLLRLLRIRQLTNKTSVAKLKAFRNMVQTGGRIRGNLLYHGAATGRWAAKGVQFQNLPRTKYDDTDIVDICKKSVYQVEKEREGIHDVASKSIRSIITCKKGNCLIDFDFSNIEGRLAAWIAGEEWKVDAFADFDRGIGADNYVLAYSRAFGVATDDVTDDERQVGKTMELSLQYQGWTGALLGMAKNFGVHFEDEVAADLCARWRDAHPCITSTWYTLGDMAIKAIKSGKQYKYKGITMRVVDGFLKVRLPSGRVIAYYQPEVRIKEHYGKEKEVVGYQGVNTYTKKWGLNYTHGGDIFQSIVQGTARDNLVFAMKNLDKAGFNIVLHVHDEVMCEEKTDRFEEMERIMKIVPEWAEGLPLAVGGWIGTRFRK